jgi:NAD+ diphosphatase
VTEATEQYFILCDDRVLVRRDRGGISPFPGSEWPVLQPWARTILPLDKGREARNFIVELAPEFDTGSDYAWVSLRSLVGRVDDNLFNLWGRAVQLLHWQKNHRYCGHCGQETVAHETEQARVCPACARSWYPRISPCVIVLISRGEELLLARSPRFREGMYSTLAGFVEPGESLEETLHREIAEEVAIRIRNIRYFGSQPWPFPGQLMLGFFADYDSGEIVIDGVEISDAGWYHCRNLPMIPGEGTIAGRLIRHYLESLNC